jgi:hypothetical protein
VKASEESKRDTDTQVDAQITCCIKKLNEQNISYSLRLSQAAESKS